MGFLTQAESGMLASKFCREHDIGNASFYKWQAKFGGMLHEDHTHQGATTSNLGNRSKPLVRSGLLYAAT